MSLTVTGELVLDEERDISFIRGDHDREIKMIEDALGISMSMRGAKVMFKGEPEAVRRAIALMSEMQELARRGLGLALDDLRYVLRSGENGQQVSIAELMGHNIAVSSRKRLVTPKTRNQIKYLEAIEGYDIVFGIGPAGTGKTYLAMAMAVNALLKKRVSRVVLARPAVEAGEKLGFLPGDMFEKVNPYLRPLYDALFDMIEMEKANHLIERGVIEIAPLAFMRGRTLNDSFIILDEAQNTTAEQMKMYLTRLGFNSKTVITGDTSQIDLPQGRASGLVEAEKVLSGVKGISVVYFSDRDVVRHQLVQEIVKAYDAYDKRREEKDRA